MLLNVDDESDKDEKMKGEHKAIKAWWGYNDEEPR